MGAKGRVVGQKFYAKLNNGNDYTENLTDFSQHLKGGVLEEIKAVFNVQIGWTTAIKKYVLNYQASNDILKIEVNGLNWINEGFSIGDTVKLSIASNQLSPPESKTTGVITAITDGELVQNSVFFADGSLADGVTLIDGAEDDYLTGTTPKTALKYDFGLIENLEFHRLTHYW